MKSGDLAAARIHAERALEVANATSNRALVSWVTTQCRKPGGATRRHRRCAFRSGGWVEHRARARCAFAEVRCGQIASPRSCRRKAKRSCARRVLAYAADHPTANGQVRDQIRRQLSELPESASAASPLAGTGARRTASPHRRRKQHRACTADRDIARPAVRRAHSRSARCGTGADARVIP